MFCLAALARPLRVLLMMFNTPLSFKSIVLLRRFGVVGHRQRSLAHDDDDNDGILEIHSATIRLQFLFVAHIALRAVKQHLMRILPLSLSIYAVLYRICRSLIRGPQSDHQLNKDDNTQRQDR